MKTINLTKALLSTLLLASTSSVVLAAPDYPEDFTPQIVYQDKDYIAEHGGSTQKQSKSTASSSSSSSKYPDDFTPQIVYQDKEYISKNKSSSTTTSAPKSSSVKSSSSSTSSTVASSETTEAPASESGGMSQYLIGLVALLAAGAFLFSKRPASEGSQSSSASAPARNTAPGGATGVASYLKQNNMAEPTGVAKYLDQQTIVNATGVEKYLIDQG